MRYQVYSSLGINNELTLDPRDLAVQIPQESGPPCAPLFRELAFLRQSACLKRIFFYLGIATKTASEMCVGNIIDNQFCGSQSQFCLIFSS